MDYASLIFSTPVLDGRETAVLDEIHELQKKLQKQLHAPRRWYGSIRRVTMARAIQGSNSIAHHVANFLNAIRDRGGPYAEGGIVLTPDPTGRVPPEAAPEHARHDVAAASAAGVCATFRSVRCRAADRDALDTKLRDSRPRLPRRVTGTSGGVCVKPDCRSADPLERILPAGRRTRKTGA